jgi:uncharacterized repeat protein (TIGR02543 family)
VDTIYFNANGGVIDATIAKKGVRYNYAVGALPVPHRDGYTFLGWHKTIYEGSQKITDTTIYREMRDLQVYARWSINTYNIRFVCKEQKDTIVSRYYGERVACPYTQDPILTDRQGDTLTFDGWYLPGYESKKWDFRIDTVTDNHTITARWKRVHSFIDMPPQVSLVYGDMLSQATLHTSGMWHCADDALRECNGHWVFATPNLRPDMTDSEITPYTIIFVPDDSIYYEPSQTTVTVRVNRRLLTITAWTSSLLMTAGNIVRAPGEWSDIPSYLASRWDILNLPPSHSSIFNLHVTVAMANNKTYYEEHGAGLYAGEVLVSGVTQTTTYDIEYVAGDLWISQISFAPPTTVTYGDNLYLNAKHSIYPALTAELNYYSNNSNIYVGKDHTGQWQARAMHTGSALVCVTSAGSASMHVPPDTLCATIQVLPRRNVTITAPRVTRMIGLPLPSAQQYDIDIVGVHNSAEIDTLYQSGLQVSVEGAPSDTPPAGIYRLVPCCISHPNYSNFRYVDGELSIIEGGSMRQIITFDSLPTVHISTGKLVVWARAETADDLSRHVQYASSNRYVADIARDTFYIMDTLRCAEQWCDTLWGAVLTLKKVGVTSIEAFNAGDAVHRAAFIQRTLRVIKDPQSVSFDAPESVDVGQSVTLHSSASSGMQVWHYITGGDTTAAVISGSVLTAKRIGTIQITAIQPGDNIYEEAQVKRTIEILPPNEGTLLYLHLSSGSLRQPFKPTTFEYGYNLSCVDDTMHLRYDMRSTIETNMTQIDDTTFVVEPFQKYGDNGKEIRITLTTHHGVVKVYTFALMARLPKDYIYYDPQKFANRMEVVNNPAVLPGGRKFRDYRWFEDDKPLSHKSGVLYLADGLKIGSVYSALAYYDERTVYNPDSVYICGQRAVAAVGNMKVYPNPARSYIVVSHPDIGVDMPPIVIYNSLNVEVASYPPQDISVNAEEHTATLDVSSLHTGLHVVRFMNVSVKFTKE